MPFAKKFRAMINFPFASDQMDDFVIECVDVRDVKGGGNGYIYGVLMVLRGPGGQAGVRRALKNMLNAHPVTFSGYGNPYQLWFRKPTLTIESLGDKRYEVQVEGAGMRIYIEDELRRFLDYLEQTGDLAPPEDQLARDALVETYLEGYRGKIARKVSRYYGKMHRKTKKDGD
ncbi:MAG: hypothetical protein P1S60_13100 [Anaerolineae bacterium]|nr:hypothetical protein [Anaerolineae bacterium]